MAGFRHCKWCGGKGCMCCDGERTKWEKAEAKRKAEWAAKDPREKLRQLENPLTRAVTAAMGDDALAALDAEIAAARAECDAEYARQFPDGPTPIFVAKRDNPDDVALLKTIIAAAGTGDVEAKAEAARATQALRDYANG